MSDAPSENPDRGSNPEPGPIAQANAPSKDPSFWIRVLATIGVVVGSGFLLLLLSFLVVPGLAQRIATGITAVSPLAPALAPVVVPVTGGGSATTSPPSVVTGAGGGTRTSVLPVTDPSFYELAAKEPMCYFECVGSLRELLPSLEKAAAPKRGADREDAVRYSEPRSPISAVPVSAPPPVIYLNLPPGPPPTAQPFSVTVHVHSDGSYDWYEGSPNDTAVKGRPPAAYYSPPPRPGTRPPMESSPAPRPVEKKGTGK